jgi:hypothetical protein
VCSNFVAATIGEISLGKKHVQLSTHLLSLPSPSPLATVRADKFKICARELATVQVEQGKSLVLARQKPFNIGVETVAKPLNDRRFYCLILQTDAMSQQYNVDAEFCELAEFHFTKAPMETYLAYGPSNNAGPVQLLSTKLIAHPQIVFFSDE